MGLTRYITPPPWDAPGNGKFSLQVFMSGRDILDIDEWINDLSPCIDCVLGWSSGNNTVALPQASGAGTNGRIFILIPPRGNTVSWTVKGVANDTGVVQHPNGFFVGSVADGASPSFVVTTGGAITGVRYIVI